MGWSGVLEISYRRAGRGAARETLSDVAVMRCIGG